VSKCPYCDFNSHVREQVDQAAWCTALLADLAHEAAVLPGRKLQSIFFGGGTPSLMPPETVAAILDAAEKAWGFADGIEITLEAIWRARASTASRSGCSRLTTRRSRSSAARTT
jgi:coproporphyrinogen III oxidase-like Fe-S oxidoreductase